MVITIGQFEAAVSEFMGFCMAKGLAARTLETYSYALDRLGSFLANTGPQDQVLDRSLLRAFITHMLGAGYSRQTIRVRMRAIRVFANFLQNEGLVSESPMQGVAIPKVPRVHPTILTSGEIRQLLGAARGSSWHATRNYAMVLTFLDTGVRLGELLGLNLADISLESRRIEVRKGKGSRQRHVYIGRSLSKALRRWQAVRPSEVWSDALFVTKDGSRLDKRNVARILERIATRAGMGDRRVYPHLLRHTFATHFIVNGGDPFSLQRILGHSDIQTTMIYVNLAGRDLMKAHFKASPIDVCLR